MKTLIKLLTLGGLFKMLFAYLDPGTGSLIIQLLIGSVVGIMVVFRNSLGNVLTLLGLRKPSEDDEVPDIEEDVQAGA